MRLSESVRPIIFGFMLAIGIILTLPHLASGAVGLSAAPGDSGLLGYTDNNPFYALFTALTAREDSGLLGCMGKISFHTLFTVLDL
jgi:hypothetical protein